jgi:ABC-2 type transport system ATP-binding protein
MRRRLEIARGLLHAPKILILDEPTIGLDPQTRNRVLEYVKALKDKFGMTVILTTHYMDEADSICDRVAIVDHGKMAKLDTSKALKDSLGGDVVEITTNKPAELAKVLSSQKISQKFHLKEGSVSVTVDFGERKIPAILAAAAKKSIQIDSVSLHKPTLEDVFLHYTGHEIREEAGTAKDMMRIRRKAWGHGR